MAQLVVDIGNTRTKLGIFNRSQLEHFESRDHISVSDINQILNSYPVTSSIISSVNEEITALEDVLRKNTKYTRFNSRLNNRINNQYKSKETLGLDRLAGIIGAQALFPETSCLVIDAGTCITYDAIDEQGVYLGGSISPGLNMRLKAMHKFTGRLPMISMQNADHEMGNSMDYRDWYGVDTVTSMLSGVLNGTVGEVISFLETYHSKYKELQVILCGGDANFFDTRLKNSIFAHTLKTEPNLVLIGLNEVIRYNDQNI